MAQVFENIKDVNLVNNLVDRYGIGVLKTLLVDRTTQKNILWADNEYIKRGRGYEPYDQVTPELILPKYTSNERIIEPRVMKSVEQQAWRTKEKAEVFTPSWLCKQMVDCLDDAFFEAEPSGFADRGQTGLTEERLQALGENRLWQKYIDNRLLEITCGEAPFICSPYDATTGDYVLVANRIGFLDRKLRVVKRYTDTYEDWFKWAIRALESSYGYEFQGDNLLIARINVLNTFSDYMDDAWGKLPNEKEARRAARVISWNLWQMDGLRGCVPSEWDVPPAKEEDLQMSLFDIDGFMDDFETEEEPESEQEQLEFAEKCVIYDWRARAPQPFESLKG